MKSPIGGILNLFFLIFIRLNWFYMELFCFWVSITRSNQLRTFGAPLLLPVSGICSSYDGLQVGERTYLDWRVAVTVASGGTYRCAGSWCSRRRPSCHWSAGSTGRCPCASAGSTCGSNATRHGWRSRPWPAGSCYGEPTRSQFLPISPEPRGYQLKIVTRTNILTHFL